MTDRLVSGVKTGAPGIGQRNDPDPSSEGRQTPLIAPGKAVALVTLKNKAKYRYLCTVPGHAAAGRASSPFAELGGTPERRSDLVRDELELVVWVRADRGECDRIDACVGDCHQ